MNRQLSSLKWLTIPVGITWLEFLIWLPQCLWVVILGLDSHRKNQQKNDYKFIMQKNENIINSWHAQFLSKAGRLTLIQSNLEALPAYVCSSFLWPQKTCNQLDSIHRNFFWKQTTTHSATPLIAWKTICQPKSMGGLGLRKTRPLNNAFIAKLGWKILTEPQNLWVSLIRNKYLKISHFFYVILNKKIHKFGIIS